LLFLATLFLRKRPCPSLAPDAPTERILACVRLLVPVSDAQATNGRGWTAFDLLADNEEWPVADFLAPHSFRPAVEEAFSRAGPGRMPRWAAQIESEALARALAPNGAPSNPARSLFRYSETVLADSSAESRPVRRF